MNMELGTFNSSMIGREERIIELKQEVNSLLAQLNRGQKYLTQDLSNE